MSGPTSSAGLVGGGLGDLPPAGRRGRDSTERASASNTAGWSRAERAIGTALLDGWSVAVNVRKSGPHKHLVPWLVSTGGLTYVGHAGPRHDWAESDFANPFLRMVSTDRSGMVRRYREWLREQPGLLCRIADGELTGRALGCWCAPQACHAEVLAEEVNRVVQRRPR